MYGTWGLWVDECDDTCSVLIRLAHPQRPVCTQDTNLNPATLQNPTPHNPAAPETPVVPHPTPTLHSSMVSAMLTPAAVLGGPR